MEMSFDGDFEVGIPRDTLFGLLADPEKFVPVLPTFHSMEMKEGDDSTAIVKVKVGIGRIHGVATTEMTLAEKSEPVRARYVGKGSVMGSAYTMNVAFDLDDAATGGGSKINWQGSTEIHGKILSIAGGGMRGYAEKEINSVIGALQSALVSVDHFESISQAAKEAPAPSEGIFAAIAAFFRGLFGKGQDTSAAADAEAKVAAPATPKRVLKPDPVRPIRDIQASIEVDRNGGDRWVGQHLRRKEDLRLVRGHGLFLDDYQSPDMLHMGFVRSPYAHAKILNIDISAAQSLAGVRCIMTGADVAEQATPFMQIGAEPGALVEDYGIATDRVRYPGEPVVMIVAESARLVQDAAELVNVDYQPLPVITRSEDAVDSDNLLHPAVGSNVIYKGTWDHGDVDAAFRDAAHVVKIDRMHFHRFSSTPIETAGAVATWSPRGDIDMISNNGLPGVTAQMIAGFLGVSTEQIRSRSHDVGGNFGTKTVIHTFMGLTALASRNSGGATVKWVETRSDNLASFHGGERTFLDTEVALDANGVITALRSHHLDDCGGYTRYEPLGCAIWCQVYPATYGLRNINIEFTQVVSNKAPCTPNRGYSRLQHLWFMERVMDICGHELGIAADEMRLRNYIQPDQFPYTTPNGNVYDSGNYPLMLEKAKELIGYDAWKEKQAAARAQGRLMGIGIGTTLDSGTNNFGQVLLVNPDSVFSGNTEGARIKIGLDGSVVVTLGSVPQGQGHETTTAMTVADELNISPDMITVRSGFDSDWNSYGGLSGTIASQFVVTGLSAVHGAAVRLKEQLRRLAAHSLQASEDELEFGVGEMGPQLSVKGDPERAINYWMLSNLANCNTAAIPEEFRDIDLNVQYVYKPPFELPDVEKKTGNQTLTYAAQLHISVVEVDKATWQPTILDYAVVDDCGVAINPKIVEGQAHGATCHGIGAAMQEAFQFDEAGNLTTATFTDYAPMTALNMPDLKMGSICTPSPFSFNGAKGCGEGGGAPLHTMSAAIQDAMHSEGVIITESHNAPSILLEAAANPNRETAVSLESR
jgi:CO/xanthine dehydrogenase Mo-binding subunit/carbon monoxide dehydrogenase subunit G